MFMEMNRWMGSGGFNRDYFRLEGMCNTNTGSIFQGFAKALKCYHFTKSFNLYSFCLIIVSSGLVSRKDHSMQSQQVFSDTHIGVFL